MVNVLVVADVPGDEAKVVLDRRGGDDEVQRSMVDRTAPVSQLESNGRRPLRDGAADDEQTSTAQERSQPVSGACG